MSSGPFDTCLCGRASHFTYRASYHAISGCEVVIRADGTGCPCRGFWIDTGRQKGDDDGVEYGHPDDERDERRRDL